MPDPCKTLQVELANLRAAQTKEIQEAVGPLQEELKNAAPGEKQGLIVLIKKATSEIEKKYASQIAAKQKQYDDCIMSKRALAIGWGGYADLDLTFGEFFAKNHTLVVRFMPQHPYAATCPLLAENGNGTYAFGVGDYRSGHGNDGVLGNSMIFVQAGDTQVVYEVKGFVNKVGGPIGYRQRMAAPGGGPPGEHDSGPLEWKAS